MTLPNTGTPTEPAQAGPFPRLTPRDEGVIGAVTSEEKEEILVTLGACGFRNQSEGVRLVLLAHQKDQRVQEAVERAIRELRIA